MKERIIMKFGEMRYGQWFRECGGNNPRIFVKLQNILPSGIPIVYDAFVARDHDLDGDGKNIQQKGRKTNSMHFNAVDIDGIPGCCPDWIPFELIECPFKQRHHDQGRNLDLPRYDGDAYQGKDKDESCFPPSMKK